MAKYVDEDRFPIDPILFRLNQARRVDHSGNVSFQGFAFSEACSTYLLTAISVNGEITPPEKATLIQAALFKVAIKQITKKTLLAGVAAEEAAFLRRREHPLRS